MVNSAAFRGFKTSKMLQHFDRHLKGEGCGGNPDPREALAFALLSVDVGGAAEAESVRDVLRRMKTAQFAGLLIEKHGFLLDEAGAESFSDLAVLVRDCLPQLFVEVLVSLIRGGIFSLTSILQGCWKVTLSLSAPDTDGLSL